MPFCPTCGTQIDAGAACPRCVSAGAQPAAAAAPAAASAGTAASGLTDNVAGMLAYVTIIPSIIFLVMDPYNKNRFIRFHSFQNIFFCIAWIVLWIALGIVGQIPDYLDHPAHEGLSRPEVQAAGNRRYGRETGQRRLALFPPGVDTTGGISLLETFAKYSPTC